MKIGSSLKRSFFKKHYFNDHMVNMLLFCFILLLNCLTPLAADDFSYSFIFASAERIDSFSDIIYSQWLHYFGWGGRSVVHFIAQTFLWWGKPLFNIFNSLVFIIYINLISYFSFGRKNAGGIICSFLAVWFLLPAISSVIFWLTGSCNYLWGTTIVFLFIYRYYKCIVSNKTNGPAAPAVKSVCLAALWFLFGIIAGWCNENTSAMGIFICFLLTLYHYKKYAKVNSWQISGIVGSVLGFGLMLLAPGNYIRADSFNTTSNPIKKIVEGIIRADGKTFMAEDVYAVLFFIFLLTYLFMLKISAIDKERKIIGSIWFWGALACNYAMSMSPYYPDRATFGVYSMFFISIFYDCKTLIQYIHKNIIADTIKILIFICCLYFSISYMEAAYDIGITYLRNNERIELVISEKEHGNDNISVPCIPESQSKYNIFSIVPDWPAYNAQGYFGVDSISVYE